MIPTIFNATQSNNYLLVLKYLTEYENDPNERDENGLTCLHYCATYGHLETAKVLVSYGAALDLKDLTSGWTALHRSIYFQHLKLSLFLIQMGARLDANDSTTPSASNAHRSNSEQLDLDLKIRDNEGRTPLDLLSYQLKNDLKMHGKRESTTNGVNYQGIIMSFGKADFTLGVPLPKSSDVSRPKRLDSLLQENILDFSAAKFHAIAVTKEGEVYSWGNGKSGKLGQGNEISQPEPALITSLSLGKIRVRKVCAAESHSLPGRALSDPEARVYLTEANWSLSSALEAYRADIEWEATHRKAKAEAVLPMDSTSGRYATTAATAPPNEFEMSLLRSTDSSDHPKSAQGPSFDYSIAHFCG